MSSVLCLVISLSLLIGTASAFIPSKAFGATTPFFSNAMTQLPMSSPQGGDSGQIERIEFTIYSDGRVEEKVVGVRGPNCQSVTEDINQMLGEVTASRPTEEMYEQEITVDQNIEQKLDGSGSNDGMTSSW